MIWCRTQTPFLYTFEVIGQDLLEGKPGPVPKFWLTKEILHHMQDTEQSNSDKVCQFCGPPDIYVLASVEMNIKSSWSTYTFWPGCFKTRASGTRTPGILEHFRNKTLVPSNYLADLLIPKHRIAFTLSLLNVLPSTLLEGKYCGVPLQDCLCPHTTREIEMAGHALLHCPFYNDLE